MSNLPSSGTLDENAKVKKEVRKMQGKHEKRAASYVDFNPTWFLQFSFFCYTSDVLLHSYACPMRGKMCGF
jgi:hypothetical protein